jgi:ribosomal protein S18 acetylase RimI-like enzyme
MSVEVRPAAMPEEVDAVAGLILDSVRWHGGQWSEDYLADGPADPDAPPLRDQLLEMANDPSVAILVAVEDGAVVGVLSGSVGDKPKGGTLRYTGRLGYVADLAVAPSHRKRGIGAELLSSFESWAVSHGAAHLRLFVHDGNTAAESLYRRAGFRTVHVELRKDL